MLDALVRACRNIYALQAMSCEGVRPAALDFEGGSNSSRTLVSPEIVSAGPKGEADACLRLTGTRNRKLVGSADNLTSPIIYTLSTYIYISRCGTSRTGGHFASRNCWICLGTKSRSGRYGQRPQNALSRHIKSSLSRHIVA